MPASAHLGREVAFAVLSAADAELPDCGQPGLADRPEAFKACGRQ
ncbi:hypothetical protein ACTWQE_10000 [Streptomyces sp. 8N706]